MVLVPGTDGDARPWLREARWIKYANEENFVLVACYFRGDGAKAYDHAAGGSGQALLNQLDVVRKKQGWPDLPVLVLGHSAGAQFAFQLARWNPQRVKAYVGIKAGGYAMMRGKSCPR
ncbi:MAG: alpha/beta hydrolase [Blastochloris sp.]|nr:alpha/beta hydrolase [Blastochloris sp.]